MAHFNSGIYKKRIIGITTFAGMLFLIFAVLNLQTACTNYYRLNTPVLADQQATAKFAESMKMNNKYFIVHSNIEDFNLTEVIIDKDSLMLRGIKRTIPSNHNIYKHTQSKRNYRFYKRNGQKVVLNEVHLYTNQVIQNGDSISIPFSSIQKAEAVQLSPITYLTYFLGIAGSIVGILTFLVIIILLTKSSCPFVYMQSDTGDFNFKGEIFGGAIYPSLERDDVLPLGEVKPISDTLRIVVANELKEKQFIDQVSLSYIQHNENVTPVWATDGKIYGITSAVKPQAAVMNRHINQLHELETADDHFCQFNDTSITGIINSVDLGFKNEKKNKNVLLILKLKNSYWFDYMFGEMTSMIGVGYNRWQEKQRQKPASEHIKWSEDQHIPLIVSIWNGSEWSEVTKLKTIGPLASRQLAIPVEINQPQEELIKIRLSCGFMFWEVDQASISFDTANTLQENSINLASATDGSGKNISPLLASADNHHLEQLKTGDEAQLEFVVPSTNTNLHTTAFLHARGYYEHVREYTGIPDVEYLKTFLKEGAFARFSKARYKLLMDSQFKSFRNVPL